MYIYIYIYIYILPDGSRFPQTLSQNSDGPKSRIHLSPAMSTYLNERITIYSKEITNENIYRLSLTLPHGCQAIPLSVNVLL